MKIANLFSGIPQELPGELTQVLLEHDGLRIERIVSRGHTSPADFWYDQEDNEWVVVLSGRARLELESGGGVIDLVAGDHLRIPAHTKHRVEWTDPDEETIWLAVFFP